MLHKSLLGLGVVVMVAGCPKHPADEEAQLMTPETAWAPIDEQFSFDVTVMTDKTSINVVWRHPAMFLSPAEMWTARTDSTPDLEQLENEYYVDREPKDPETHVATLRGLCVKGGTEMVEVALHLLNGPAEDDEPRPDPVDVDTVAVTCGGENPNPNPTTAGMPTATDTSTSSPTTSATGDPAPADTPEPVDTDGPPNEARFFAVSLDNLILYGDPEGEPIDVEQGGHIWGTAAAGPSAAVAGGGDEAGNAVARVIQNGKAMDVDFPGELPILDSAYGDGIMLLRTVDRILHNAGDWTDPKAWTPTLDLLPAGGASIAVDDGCVAIEGMNVWFASDCLNWEMRVAQFFPAIVGRGGGMTITFTSTGVPSRSMDDGMTWQQGTAPMAGFTDVTYGGGRFVAVGRDTAAYSDDGLAFEAVDVGVDIDMVSVAYDPTGDSFMVVGGPGADNISRAISFDGAESWAPLEDAAPTFYSDVAALALPS